MTGGEIADGPQRTQSSACKQNDEDDDDDDGSRAFLSCFAGVCVRVPVGGGVSAAV